MGPLNSIPGAVSSLRLAQAADYLRKQGAPCIAAALLGTPPEMDPRPPKQVRHAGGDILEKTLIV